MLLAVDLGACPILASLQLFTLARVERAAVAIPVASFGAGDAGLLLFQLVGLVWRQLAAFNTSVDALLLKIVALVHALRAGCGAEECQAERAGDDRHLHGRDPSKAPTPEGMDGVL